MDRFAEFINMAQETRTKSLAPRSESTYQSYIDVYDEKAWPLEQWSLPTLRVDWRGESRKRNYNKFDRINNQKVILTNFSERRRL